MSKPVKAALLSAFVFPGVGHFFLKKYAVAAILASASFVAVYYLVSSELQMSLQIIEQIQAADVPPDVLSITQLVTQQMSAENSQLLDIATYVAVFCWLVGIVDSYRLGRLQDNSD